MREDLARWKTQHAPQPKPEPDTLPPPRATRETVEIAPPVTAASTAAPAPAPAPAPAAELASLRIPAERANRVMYACEELVTVVGRRRDDESDMGILDDLLGRTAAALSSLRVELKDYSPAIARAVENATAAVESATVWSRARRLRESQRWRGVSQAAHRVLGEVRELRVVAAGTLAAVLERTVQSAATELRRQVSFTLDGGDVELDRRVVERLREPLAHLLRNAVDHGIEPPEQRRAAGKKGTGHITVCFVPRGSEIVITVTDDGRGMDEGKVLAAAREKGVAGDSAADLIFAPGLTSRDEATTLSGRGVGLDVVRHEVASLGGRITVSNRPGQGMTFQIVAPTDLSLVRGLIVEAREAHFVLPATSVVRVLRLGPDSQRIVEGKTFVPVGSRLVASVDLAELLGIGARVASESTDVKLPAVLLAVGQHEAVLRVDKLVDERELVVKPLGSRVKRIPFVHGAAVMPGGGLALALDAAELVERARPGTHTEVAQSQTRARVLCVDDSITTRQLVRSLLETAGYRVGVAADGEQAWTQLARGESYDLVVSDVEMPYLDGFGLLERIRASARFTDLPVVLVTGLGADADRQRALDLGADAYVVKSGFDQKELLDAVEALL